jgi:hypothetical protein
VACKCRHVELAKEPALAVGLPYGSVKGMGKQVDVSHVLVGHSHAL